MKRHEFNERISRARTKLVAAYIDLRHARYEGFDPAPSMADLHHSYVSTLDLLETIQENQRLPYGQRLAQIEELVRLCSNHVKERISLEKAIEIADGHVRKRLKELTALRHKKRTNEIWYKITILILGVILLANFINPLIGQ